MRFIPLLFSLLIAGPLLAQEDAVPPSGKMDSLKVRRKTQGKSVKKGDAATEAAEITIKDYKIISFARDTTYLDTTLTIQKEYKYNYLRRDDFELMPFSNVGQPYNKLGVEFERKDLYPMMGARAKHFNYMEVWDIDYYNVPTPMTDLFFKTTFEQGQLLDANLTFNTSRRLNFSIAYKGFRSLGKYSFDQAASGNFRTTTNYETKNRRYQLRAHIAAQEIETEENGGLALKEIQFESGEAEFTDRSRIEVRFSDANNKILGKRYFWQQQYKLLKQDNDSTRIEKTSLAIGHQFNYETKYYQFSQDAQNDYFGPGIVAVINDKATLKTMYNQFSLEFYNAVLGRLQGNVNLYNYNYDFNSILITEAGTIPNQLKGEEISVGADYNKSIKGFDVDGSFKYTIAGKLTGNILDASAGYRINENNKFRIALHSSSRLPDFNFLLYQSDYLNYNWDKIQAFKKQRVYSLQFNLDSKLLGSLTAKFATLDNYTYFAPDVDQATQEQLDAGLENAYLKPFQEGDGVSHLKVKYNKEFKVGKFALNNTVMYQNVIQTNEVLNVPQLVTRNTLYYSSNVFKKAMFLQTGVTFKYFTAYHMDAYNPLLGEFYVQNAEKLGAYPLLDFFINARIQQTRIYLKAEHFNSSFGKNNFYAAPSYPYRDFVIRFGLVWNFFS
ncbi:MAG: hypothetical protein E4H26_10955 [Flavobacteriales bacterium]|nr:MAG: hypothetical protein E4H26_10955 [Flavobacteriales bacterium]